MGREVRKVPADWEHPKVRGSHVPLFDHYRTAVSDWDEHAAEFDRGEGFYHEHGYARPGDTYADHECDRPEPSDYMPDWPDGERTHFMMYEDTSEGTPISPAFESGEELARWLADNRVSSFGLSRPAPYEWWLKCIEGTVFTGMVMTVAGGVVTEMQCGGDREAIAKEAT